MLCDTLDFELCANRSESGAAIITFRGSLYLENLEEAGGAVESRACRVLGGPVVCWGQEHPAE